MGLDVEGEVKQLVEEIKRLGGNVDGKTTVRAATACVATLARRRRSCRPFQSLNDISCYFNARR
jgi:xanthine dehydrogenase molybdopterin-binding subunit B|tara:strand:+ start:1548 stop:1739 length:192 start_codon:yes stop_codon:yes gene_type:complete